MAVLPFRRADTAPLADPDVIAAAVLAANTQPMSGNHGADSLAENFRPAGCNRNCAKGRMCDCVPDIEDRSPQPKPEISNGVLWACVVALLLGLSGAAVQMLQAGSVPVIDKPAPASAPTTTTLKGLT